MKTKARAHTKRTKKGPAQRVGSGRLVGGRVTDTDRLNWLEANPRRIAATIGRLGARDAWSYTILGTPHLAATAREAIDKAMAGDAELFPAPNNSGQTAGQQ